MAKSKTELLDEYRDFLHKIAVADTLLEVDGCVALAHENIELLSDRHYINLKEENDMKTTVSVFRNKTVKRILEASE